MEVVLLCYSSFRRLGWIGSSVAAVHAMTERPPAL